MAPRCDEPRGLLLAGRFVTSRIAAWRGCSYSRNRRSGQTGQYPRRGRRKESGFRQGRAMELGVTRQPVFPIGSHEDCTRSRVSRSKIARRIERLLRRLHVDSEDCRLSARAIMANQNVRFPVGQARFPGSRAVDCAAHAASLSWGTGPT